MKYQKREKNLNWKGGISLNIKEYQARWWQNNKERLSEKRRQYSKNCHAKKLQYIQDYKLLKGCSICGYKKCASALDFHHNGDKNFNISQFNYRSLEVIRKEIDKCDLQCKNCHAELHEKENKNKNQAFARLG